jgi:hypothetical protein
MYMEMDMKMDMDKDMDKAMEKGRETLRHENMKTWKLGGMENTTSVQPGIYHSFLSYALREVFHHSKYFVQT